MKKYDILFSALTLTEVEFLHSIAQRFINNGYNVGLALLHEAGRGNINKEKYRFI